MTHCKLCILFVQVGISFKISKKLARTCANRIGPERNMCRGVTQKKKAGCRVHVGLWTCGAAEDIKPGREVEKVSNAGKCLKRDCVLKSQVWDWSLTTWGALWELLRSLTRELESLDLSPNPTLPQPTSSWLACCHLGQHIWPAQPGWIPKAARLSLLKAMCTHSVFHSYDHLATVFLFYGLEAVIAHVEALQSSPSKS